MIKKTQNNRLRLSALFLFISLAGITTGIVANPPQPTPTVIYVTSNQGMGTLKKLLWGTAIIGAGALYVDAHFFNGHLVWNRIRDRFLGDIYTQITVLRNQLTDVQNQVTANGERIDAVGTTAKNLEQIAHEHTTTLDNHTGRLKTLSEQATETQENVKNNGTEIAAARKDVQGVRTVVDKHTGQLNDQDKKITGLQDGIQAARNEVQSVKKTIDGHTEMLGQLRDGQTRLTDGQATTLAVLERLEDAINARGNTPFATMLRTSAAQSPLVIRTLNGTQNNVHTFGTLQ